MLHVMSAPNAVTALPRSLSLPLIARHWRHWFLIGLGTVLLGTAAIVLVAALPAMAVTLLGAVLVGDALLQWLHARLLPRQGGFGWRMTGAPVSLAAGLSLLAGPSADPLWPAFVIQLLLLLAGIARGFLAMTLEPLPGWHWLFAIAVVTASLGLGLLVLPPGPPTLLASLVGLVLLLDGTWTLQTARMARRRSPALLPRPL